MAQLLVQEVFDAFLLEEVRVLTASELVLSGRRNANWYDTGLWERMQAASEECAAWMTWKEVKTVVFSYIKGSRTPDMLRVSLKVQSKQAVQMLADSGVLSIYEQQRPDLFLQIRYEKGMLSIVTGAAYPSFTMDKTVEKAWDVAICTFLKQHKIPFEK